MRDLPPLVWIVGGFVILGVALMISEGRVDSGPIVTSFGSLVGGIACTSLGWSMLRRSRKPIQGADER